MNGFTSASRKTITSNTQSFFTFAPQQTRRNEISRISTTSEVISVDSPESHPATSITNAESPPLLPFRRTVSHDEAQYLLHKLLRGERLNYCLLASASLKKPNGKGIRSNVYKNYEILCHANSKTPAGWGLCKYVRSGGCTVERGCQKFEPENETSTMMRHFRTHLKKSDDQHTHARSIGKEYKRNILNAACLAVVEDLRPYSFTEGRGMREFIKAIFEAGQATPVGDNIDQLDFIPSKNAITMGVSAMAACAMKTFSKSLVDDALQYGGGMSIDGVTLKLQDKKFYDLTLHYISFEGTSTSGKKKPHMHCRTLLLAEAEEGSTASEIRMQLNQSLLSKYEIDLAHLCTKFTLITDYAAVMPNIVGASVSRYIAPLNEKWMGCVAHQLNTVMRAL